MQLGSCSVHWWVDFQLLQICDDKIICLFNIKEPVSWVIPKVLESPESLKAFESKVGQKWAKEIIIDYYSRSPIVIMITILIMILLIRTEEGWLLGPMVKILTIMAKQNPTPGGLSRWTIFPFSPINLFLFLQILLSGGVLQGWPGRGKRNHKTLQWLQY